MKGIPMIPYDLRESVPAETDCLIRISYCGEVGMLQVGRHVYLKLG